jgi:hypothetical protein
MKLRPYGGGGAVAEKYKSFLKKSYFHSSISVSDDQFQVYFT